MPRSLAGSRIRAARRAAGLSQVELAQAVGISASYLNLIEHNRRRIGGRILNAIAGVLNKKPSDLAEGGDSSLLSDLRAAAAGADGIHLDPDTADAFAGAHPAWADLVLAQARRIQDQAGVIAALSDRLGHDPFLSENVHAMLSHITAVRSTSGLLSDVANIPDQQRRQFYANIHDESRKLSDTAAQLAEYLGAADSRPDTAATAEEAMDQFLRANDYRFARIDEVAQALDGLPVADSRRRLGTLIRDMLDAEPLVQSGEARALAEIFLGQYADDAIAMPLNGFHAAAAAATWDPAALAARYGQTVQAVFRRLAALARPGLDAPRFGLVAVSASGYPLQRVPMPNFPLPRHGNACPLLPLFAAFTQPGLPRVDVIEHDNGQRFRALSIAEPRPSSSFGGPVDLIAAMLIAEPHVFDHLPPSATRQIGTSCRICTRDACAARSQPRLDI